METKRICKKCLIRDFDEGALLESIKSYVENLPPDIKTEEDVYEKRLKTCEACEKLLKGTCLVCGCYVEMRAAVKGNVCPLPKAKWD